MSAGSLICVQVGIYAYGSDRGSYLRRQNIAITRWSYLHVAFRQEDGESVARRRLLLLSGTDSVERL
jgi:hypothetical protein